MFWFSLQLLYKQFLILRRIQRDTIRNVHRPSCKVPIILVRFCVISGFRRDVDEICALLGCYAALSGSSVPTFRNNLSISSSRVWKSKMDYLALLEPWRWDQQVAPKRRYRTTAESCVISQKMADFSSDFNRTWNSLRRFSKNTPI
jgi:hypothetical protein